MNIFTKLTFIGLLLSCNIAKSTAIMSVQSGPWGDPNTWDCTCVPLVSDDVTVVSGHDVSISGTVSQTGTVTINGIIILTGTFDGSGLKTVANGGVFQAYGIIGGPGELVISTGGTLEWNGDNGFNVLSTTIQNYGTTNWNGGHINYFCQTGQFINQASGVLNMIGNQNPRYWVRADLLNYGTINKSTNIDISFDDQIGCAGTPYTFNNEGIVNITSGHLGIYNHDGTHSGIFNNSAMLTFSGTQTLTTTGNVTGNGIFTISGTTIINIPYTFACSSISLTGTLSGIGEKTIFSGTTLNSYGTIGGPGEVIIDNGGTLEWNGDNGFNILSTTIQNYGTTNWNGGHINYFCQTGQFINQASGVLNMIGNQNPRYWVRADLLNYGTINKSTNIDISFANLGCAGTPYTFNNEGIINITSGHLSIYSHNGTHDGIFNNSATLTFGGTQTLTTSGNVTGSGIFNISGTTNINVPYTFACPSITVTGTLSGTGEKTIQSGTTLDSYGTIGGPGELIISNGGTFNLYGSGRFNAISTTIQNYGISNWNDGHINYFCQIGQFINQAGGVLNMTGSQTPRYWAKADLLNYGTINKTSNADIVFSNPFGCSGAPYTFNNEGLFNINAGNVSFSSFDFLNNGQLNGNGTLDFYGIFTQNGSISPGNSPGILTMNTLPSGTTATYIELQGTTTPGMDYDRIAISGTGIMNGVLDISFLGGFNPVINDEFIIMTCSGGCTGQFSSIVHPGNNPNAWTVLNMGNEVKLILANALLPVELFSVSAKVISNDVAVIFWETASEINNKGFYIEKSKNGLSFEPIGFVEGTGNSAQKKYYEFYDKTFHENAYYRLRQVDFDAKSDYSQTIHLKNFDDEISSISLFPNPVVSELTLKMTNSSNGVVYIVNSLGKVVFQKTLDGDSENHTLDVSSLPTGLYSVIYSDGRISKFIKI